MEALLILLGIGFAASPFVALAVGFGARRRADRLVLQLVALERRLEGLERRLAAPGAGDAVREGDTGIAAAEPGAGMAAGAADAAPETTAGRMADAAAPPSEAADEHVGPWAELPPADAPPPGEPDRAAPPRRRVGLEEAIGARWSVWLGGLALALGGVFLVRYSIEQGLVGPAARIALGALFASVLLGAGEWTRRRDVAAFGAFARIAAIPAVLTAAGTVAAFATTYAAHALYGFLGPAAAFALLGLVGVSALLLSAVHGPALAALGLVGSYAAPLLVSSREPSVWPVVLYVLVVTLAALTLARLRVWLWLALAAVAGGLGWGLVILTSGAPMASEAALALAAGLFAAFFHRLALGIAEAPEPLRDRPPEWPALAALTGALGLAFLAFALAPDSLAALALVVALSGALGAAASRHPALSLGAPAAGLAVTLAAAVLALAASDAPDRPDWPIAGTDWPHLVDRRSVLVVALALAALPGLGGSLSALRAVATAPWTAASLALTGAAASVLILLAVYVALAPDFGAGFEAGFAAASFGLALALAWAMEAALRRLFDQPSPRCAPSILAAGAAASFASGLYLALDGGWLVIALALAALLTAWLSLLRPLPVLRALAVGFAGLTLLRAIDEPGVVPDLGAAPILNWLLPGYGVPAIAFAWGAVILRRRRVDVWTSLLETLALVFAALLLVVQIRHVAHDGDLFAAATGLGELSALTLAAFILAAGLARAARRTSSVVFSSGAAALAAAGIGGALLGHLVLFNPMLTGDPVGGAPVVNLLLIAYLVPAVAAACLARIAGPDLPRPLVRALDATALLMAFAWASLETRRAFHGSVLTVGPTTDAEMWAYSVVWLAFGLALLLAGLVSRSPALRAASGLVIAATVAKVFLFDMAALTGALRAASFIALGACLIGIGRLYQRLLLPRAVPVPRPDDASGLT